MNDFIQAPPQMHNTYGENRWLRPYLRHKLPTEICTKVDVDLNQLGEKCATVYLALARRAEREKPIHIPYDAWGNRIDEIRVSSAWEELQDISAREGMIAIGYRRDFAEYSRLYQFAKLYLFHPSSAFFTCPLAMADGAAKVLEVHGKEDVHRAAFAHLTSSKPEEFWTSGQWMTEKTGGSDVSQTSTVVRYEGAQARLYGTKWFSSATTSQVALALARCPDSPLGSKGLTLFLLSTYLRKGQLNHIRVLRLKDKLGTWALPTAELSLEGTLATQVGDKNQGVKTVASMLNITRLYNSVCSVGQMTRALEQLRDYSSRRMVFGALLHDQPLHQLAFAEEELKCLASFLLTFELVHLLGREECRAGSPGESEILRLMTPVCKLFSARSAIQVATEVVEGFGGAGYIEDTGIPVHLRDSQVFSIWEGPTHVLCLDLIRVLQKGDAFRALQEDVLRRLQNISKLNVQGEQIRKALGELEKGLATWGQSAQDVQLASSRGLAFYLARFYSFVLLLSWAEKESEGVRKSLEPWIDYFAGAYLGHWQPLPPSQVRLAQIMWQERLKN